MLINDLIRNIILYPISKLMDYDVIDEDPEFIRELGLNKQSSHQYRGVLHQEFEDSFIR